MTDYTDIVGRLRTDNAPQHVRLAAADAIEAQAARIAELDKLYLSSEYMRKLKDDRIAELEKIVDVMYADGDKNDARVMRYKAIASKAIREQVAIREEYEAVISELKSALRPFIEEYEGWSENDYKYVPANVLRARSALARVKDSK